MNKLILKLRSALVIAALATACFVPQTQAATLTNTYSQPFDAAGNTTPFVGGSVAGWLNWYGLYGNTAMTNDPSMDAGNDPTSGSLRVYLPFGPGGDQQAFFGSFHNQYGYDFTDTADGLLYTNITFDVRVAAGTKPNAAGNFGDIGVGFYQTGTMGNLTIPGSASNGWVHLTLPIDKTKAGISSIAAFLFVYQSYSGYPTNPITFFIDNASLNKGGPPPAPPTLNLEKPIAGLNVIDNTPGPFDRQSLLSTTTTGNSWVGSATPVTYSFTITNFPAGGSSIAAQMFLIGSVGPIPSFETAPDYNEANVVLFAVGGSPGSAIGSLRYKANQPNGNSMLFGGAPYTNAPGSGSANFGSGNLGTVTNSAVLGTWSLTFANNTNITVTAPDGTTGSFVMPAADAALFADTPGFAFLIGSQANSTGAIGQRVVYSRAQIQGATVPLNDNFLSDATLNTNLWTKLASVPAGVLVVPANTVYIVNWTLPDIGFSLQIASNLTSSASWQNAGLTPAGQIGSVKTTLVPSSSSPGKIGFFRLIKRTFTQLQVLLPGQTNAPGTALGYVGTPTTISLAAQASPTTVTVNAVDSAFNIISGVIDQVHLTTSDGGAFLPGDLSMVNGTATFSDANGVLFQTTGSQTVTATDTTDGTKTPNTSASVTIVP